MTENQKKEDFESVFSNEIQIINEANELNTESLSKEDLIVEFAKLRDSYNSLLKHTSKLVRISDSTQRKLIKAQNTLTEQNEKINLQNEELTALNATKDKFFSIISHDLKNPITSILMLSQVFEYAGDALTAEDMKSHVSSIGTAVKRLHDLFENLLRWARTQTGNIEFSAEELSCKEVFMSVMSLLEVNASNKSIKLEINIDNDIVLKADKNMLETVIRNLVANAIKFTPQGGTVTLGANKVEKDYLFYVSDSGIGISEEDKAKLFRLDSHFKTKGTANETGTGLGLVLCKEFVVKHGGKIWAESTPGEGSTFNFTIPSDL